MMRYLWFCLTAVVGLSGCATFRGVAPGSRNRWCVITTTHFVIFTDLDERAAGKAAGELEATRDALIAAVSPGATLRDMARMRVFVLADAHEYHEVFGPDVSGLYAPTTPGAFFIHAPVDVVHAGVEPRSRSTSSTLMHTMAHQLVAAVFPHAPPWLDEGLAQFVETVQVATDGRSIVLGRRNARARARFVGNSTISVRRLLEWKEPIGLVPEATGSGLYGTSYLFVHWLYHHRGEALAVYLRALAGDVDPQKAWDEAFPGFDPDAMSSILADYGRSELPVVSRPFTTSAPFLDLRPLEGADLYVARAHIMRGAARFAGTGARAELEAKARAEIKSARALSPAHWEALALDTWTLGEERVRWAYQATAAHPQDARAFAFLASVSNNVKDRERHYRHALDLDPNDPDVLNAFALFLLGRGRPSEALPVVQRAHLLAPHEFEILEAYAEVLQQLNRCEAATAEALRAVHRAREADAPSLRRVTKRWMDRKIACRGREEAAPSAGLAVAAVESPDATLRSPEGRDPGTSPQADAPAEEDPIESRSGWLVTASASFGYLFGSFEGMRGFTGLLNGTAFDVGAFAGYWLVPEVSLSLGVGFLSHSFSDQPIKNVNLGTTDGFQAGRLGVLANLYAGRMSPLHFAFGADLLLGTWKSAEGVYGSPLPATEDMTGYSTHASAGYAWRALGGMLGPSLRLYHGNAESLSTSVSFTGVALVGNAVF
jgi:tetratricopeptide (TPR) repeat protein